MLRNMIREPGGMLPTGIASHAGKDVQCRNGSLAQSAEKNSFMQIMPAGQAKKSTLNGSEMDHP